MKNLLTLFITILTISSVISQNKSRKVKKDEFKDFATKLAGTKTETPISKFEFDVTKSPELKLTIPIPSKRLSQFYFDGKIGSKNDFTPLIGDGEWLPDTQINFNGTLFLSTISKFYSSEIKTKFKGIIDNATLNEASQLFWVWTNIKAGYGFSELETYNNDTSLLNSDKFSKESINSFIFNMDTNLYFYPSKKHLKWLSFLGKIGFEYKSNDDNYNALKTVHIRDVQNITDNDGNTIEVKSDVKKVKEGEIVTSNSANINWNFMTVFIPWDKFYIGLSNFGERTYTKDLASTDIGFAVTIPIEKKESGSTKESVPATFTLKYEIPDVENNFSTLDLKEKAVLGFTIGLPLNIL